MNTTEVVFVKCEKFQMCQMCSDLALPQKQKCILMINVYYHITRLIQLNDNQHYQIFLSLRYPGLKMPSNKSFVGKRLT